jgi:hypothetical protein
MVANVCYLYLAVDNGQSAIGPVPTIAKPFPYDREGRPADADFWLASATQFLAFGSAQPASRKKNTRLVAQ